MSMTQETIEINKLELLSAVQVLKNQGFRLAQICATRTETAKHNNETEKEIILELLYSFEDGECYFNYKIKIHPNEQIESISWLYPYSFIYENEMKDLFSVNIEDINLDFGGSFYKTSVKTPFMDNFEKGSVRNG